MFTIAQKLQPFELKVHLSKWTSN